MVLCRCAQMSQSCLSLDWELWPRTVLKYSVIKTYKGNGGKPRRIFILGFKWRWIVSLTLRPLCSIFSRFRGVTTDGIWIAYIHHSELKVITALSPISAHYKLTQHPLSLFPAGYVFNRRSLTTASNSENSWDSRARVLSLQSPV
jgi:hypothetical protein